MLSDYRNSIKEFTEIRKVELTYEKYETIVFALFIAYNWFTFFQYNYSLWFRKLIAAFEIK